MRILTTGLLFLLIIFPSLSCKKKIPPVDAETMVFTRNSSIRNQVIYQHDSIHAFKKSEYLHRYWTCINEKASRILHIRLLGNNRDILFTVYFPGHKKKIYSRPLADKGLTGCYIEQDFTDDEFIIEVLVPVAVTYKVIPEYRIFAGIRGLKPIEFCSRQ